MYMYLDKSFVITSIIGIKYKYYKESFATFEEVNILQDLLQKRINENKYDILIIDDIDDNYFDVYDGVYILKKGMTVNGLLNKYSVYSLPTSMIGTYKTVFDDDFILENIKRIKCRDQRNLHKGKEIVDILDKVLSNPLILNNTSYFFECIARELSAEEYRYLTKFINNKNCDNCLSCDCTNRKMEGSCCSNWVNDELVGKKKILSK